MNFTEAYLAKHNFEPYIAARPHPELGLCAAIPSYKEPDLIRSLQSLWECERPSCAVEVIVVVNAPEGCDALATEQNLRTLKEASEWVAEHHDSRFQFHLVYSPGLPAKFAGVGFARKIGMDEAAYRLNLVGKTNGIIAGFDADSLCDANYLVEIDRHFKRLPKSPGASVYFEHPLSGDGFSAEVYAGIARYELHLRYLNLALRYTGHPHAWHTVGSSFAVRMDAYVKQGGMNRRQAGEDFYFLQKIISLGNFSEINTTRVIPSPRQSDRVPFGTGASMNKWHKGDTLETYCFEAYKDLKGFLEEIDGCFKAEKETVIAVVEKLPRALRIFLLENDFYDELASVSANCATLKTYRERFYRWFNAFKAIKYLNFGHDGYFEKADVTGEALKLLNELGIETTCNNEFGLLEVYRKIDRKLVSGLNPQ
ncbi:MAG: hypothetical protein Q8928_05955 [Bacteroidota bacterium]|nr:hypothetical protein [Bacteroidota bacterium]